MTTEENNNKLSYRFLLSYISSKKQGDTGFIHRLTCKGKQKREQGGSQVSPDTP